MRKTNLKKNTQNKKDRIGLMGKITSEHSLSQGKCAIEMAGRVFYACVVPNKPFPEAGSAERGH